jgi:hypothetical protein
VIYGLAIGWLLGVGLAIAMLEFAAASLADRFIDDLDARRRRERAGGDRRSDPRWR